MPAKHPSCAVHVRLRPADYLRIHAASLALEITAERFIRALVLSALEYYDREDPGEPFRNEISVNFERERADGAYLRLRKRLGADEAKRIMRERVDDPGYFAEAVKPRRDKRVADIPTEFMDEYRKLRGEFGADEAKRMIGEEVRRKAGAR